MTDTVNVHEILNSLGKTHFQYNISVFDCVHSTNDIAKELISSGTAEELIIISQKQSGGRGRNNKTFSSPEGGVYISFVYNGNKLDDKQSFSMFAPCIAVCKAIENYLGVYPQIKWPNDIMLDITIPGLTGASKKICGILTETQGGSTFSEHIIVGIGINYSTNLDELPIDIRQTAGTLRDYTFNNSNKTISKFISKLIDELDSLCIRPHEWLLHEYKMRTNILDKDITVFTDGQKAYAKAIDICEDGALLIRKTNGEITKIYAGDVSIRTSHREE